MGSKFATATRIASRQHGRVARRQLLAAGISRHLIHDWLEDGRLHPVHRGVYAAGHVAPSLQAAYMAAVLAGGPSARLSHRAAAYLLRLLTGAPPQPEITVPTTAHRRRPGVVIHRVRFLHELDVAALDAIPITIVPRVLLDLAPVLPHGELGRACDAAWVHHRTTPAQIESCIARNPDKKGAAKLRRALGADVTLSDLELLSYRFHASRQAFERDVARRRRSQHIAYSWGEVVERGAATVAELRQRLFPTPLAPRA